MKILFVAYFFPPHAHATAVERTVMVIKGLSEEGHEIGLITARNYTYSSKDYSFLKYVPENLKVVSPSALEHSTFCKSLSNLQGAYKNTFRKFIWPDSRALWLLNAIPASSHFTKVFKPDVVVSVAPPYTDLLLGYLLSRRLKVPHVVDFLDPWSDDLYDMYPLWWQKELTASAEKEILKRVKGVIVATYPMKWRLIEKYPFLKPEMVENITFGIKEDLANRIESPDYSKPFAILYLGTLQGGHKNPKSFVDAFREFCSRHPEVILKIVGGKIEDGIKDLLNKEIPNRNLQIMGYVKNENIHLLVNESHVLWLLISRARGFELVMPAKTITYLGLERPILATVPEGWTAEFLKKAGVTVVSCDRKDEILMCLEELYQKYLNHDLNGPESSVTEEFKYSTIARKYGKFLETSCNL
ncbi:MAG: glycosyltransferase [Candidatus Hydrothermia bacterium]